MSVSEDGGTTRVLVCDDEPAVRRAIDRALRLDGYAVDTVADGGEALRLHAETAPDLVVLDVLMPQLDGLEVCRRLRTAGADTPVLLLTVRDGVRDIVAGLDAGADDYLTKPFALAELRARLRALLRRTAHGERVLELGDLRMDAGTREVRRADRPIRLTRTEFSLLELLLRHAEEVLPRHLIFRRVWGYDLALQTNSLEVYVGYLRRKLEADGEPRLLHTVRGVGYVLREQRPVG